MPSTAPLSAVSESSLRTRPPRLSGWSLATIGVSLIVAAPLIAVAVIALRPSGDIWSHLANTVLWTYIAETVTLMAGVGFGVFILGTGTAWLVTMCRFPGRTLFNWALLLPLAVPAYILAFVITDQLEYAGPVQSALRDIFGWRSARDYWFPDIRSTEGAVIVMSLVLYPYVYLLARAAFLEQSVCVLEVSRTLGKSSWRAFWHVALPLARPAIAVGMTLALMETLNDYGTVSFFGVQTFTSGIYDVWLNMNSRTGAAQLASLLMGFVLILVVLERMARRSQRYHHTTTRFQALPATPLSGWRAFGAVMACALPVLLGFVLPAGVLTSYALEFHQETWEADYLTITANSLTLSTLAAIGAVGLGMILAYGLRINPTPLTQAAVRFASIGYAVPGAILAIGVIIPLGGLDNIIDQFARDAFGAGTGLIFSGTIAAILFGYIVRFLALSFCAIEASLDKVTHSMDGAARTLGLSSFQTLKRVHFPLVRGSLLTAGLMVFVDCMKELPMTIILRPFNYETLATFVFQYASDELLEESALGALTIVGAGIIPVILLSVTVLNSRQTKARRHDA